MFVRNAEIAEIFNQYADLLEIDGANQFRVRAYRTAARSIGDLSQNVSDMLREGKDLSELTGIGEDLARKISSIVKTGQLPELEKLKKRMPGELSEIMGIAGLGPKRTSLINRELGVSSIKELESAAKAHKIRGLAGFGEKTEKTILDDIRRQGTSPERKKRVTLPVVEQAAEPLLAYLRQTEGVKEVTAAGSYRRKMETVGDLDILVTQSTDSDVMERFIRYEDMTRVLFKGSTKSTVILRFGLQVDLRLVAEESYGAALHYFTGAKSHSIAVREMGVKHGLKINEYGVFKGNKRVAGRTEEDVYRQVGLPYFEPELRENRGELEAARANSLPKLLGRKQDVKM